MADALRNILPRYPSGPGYRDDEASRDGARLVHANGARVTQSEFALSVVERAGPIGIRANDVFAAPGAPFPDLSTCRARLSELKRQGKIAKRGDRTPGNSGVNVNLWIAARYAPRPAEEDGQGDLFGVAA